jgi:excisionase family DNA binding protein
MVCQVKYYAKGTESADTQHAAQQLRLSTRRIRALIDAGKLKAEKIGRDWMINQSAIDALKKLDRPRGRPSKSQK